MYSRSNPNTSLSTYITAPAKSYSPKYFKVPETSETLKPSETLKLPSFGTKERKCIKQIYLFVANFILNALLTKWGKRYEELTAQRIQGESQTRVPVFDQLTSPFSRDQLDELEKRLEVGTPTRIFLSKWKAKGWIKETQKYVYEKLC